MQAGRRREAFDVRAIPSDHLQVNVLPVGKVYKLPYR